VSEGVGRSLQGGQEGKQSWGWSCVCGVCVACWCLEHEGVGWLPLLLLGRGTACRTCALDDGVRLASHTERGWHASIGRHGPLKGLTSSCARRRGAIH
jgi:hypothetical protein